MKIDYDQGRLSIFWGDKSSSVSPLAYTTFSNGDYASLIDTDGYISLCNHMMVPAIVFAHQVHGIAGKKVCFADTIDQVVMHNVDFLYTNTPGVAIGIFTADCVPLILYDPVHRAIAAVHIGWRGLGAYILDNALQAMQAAYGSSLAALQIFIGPSAGVCCYEVDKDFIQSHSSDVHAFFSVGYTKTPTGAYRFDLQKVIREQLYSAGVVASNVHAKYALCTICSPLFCSYRRERHNAGRQMTVAVLHV